MKLAIRSEWIKIRDELQFQYFDIHHKMERKNNLYQKDIYREVLQIVSRKLQHLDGLVNPPIETNPNSYKQLK